MASEKRLVLFPYKRIMKSTSAITLALSLRSWYNHVRVGSRYCLAVSAVAVWEMFILSSKEHYTRNGINNTLTMSISSSVARGMWDMLLASFHIEGGGMTLVRGITDRAECKTQPNKVLFLYTLEENPSEQNQCELIGLIIPVIH